MFILLFSLKWELNRAVEKTNFYFFCICHSYFLVRLMNLLIPFSFLLFVTCRSIFSLNIKLIHLWVKYLNIQMFELTDTSCIFFIHWSFLWISAFKSWRFFSKRKDVFSGNSFYLFLKLSVHRSLKTLLLKAYFNFISIVESCNSNI